MLDKITFISETFQDHYLKMDFRIRIQIQICIFRFWVKELNIYFPYLNIYLLIYEIIKMVYSKIKD